MWQPKKPLKIGNAIGKHIGMFQQRRIEFFNQNGAV